MLRSYVDAYACETESCCYTDLDYGTVVLNTNHGGGGENHAAVLLIYHHIYDTHQVCCLCHQACLACRSYCQACHYQFP